MHGINRGISQEGTSSTYIVKKRNSYFVGFLQEFTVRGTTLEIRECFYRQIGRDGVFKGFGGRPLELAAVVAFLRM